RSPLHSPLFPYTTLFRSELDRIAEPFRADTECVECLGRRLLVDAIADRDDPSIPARDHFGGRFEYRHMRGLRSLHGSPGEESLRSEEHTSELQSLAYLVC